SYSSHPPLTRGAASRVSMVSAPHAPPLAATRPVSPLRPATAATLVPRSLQRASGAAATPARSRSRRHLFTCRPIQLKETRCDDEAARARDMAERRGPSVWLPSSFPLGSGHRGLSD